MTGGVSPLFCLSISFLRVGEENGEPEGISQLVTGRNKSIGFCVPLF